MKPPIEPMLAELKDELPNGDFFYEPKLDGFRGMLFAGHDRPSNTIARIGSLLERFGPFSYDYRLFI